MTNEQIMRVCEIGYNAISKNGAADKKYQKCLKLLKGRSGWILQFMIYKNQTHDRIRKVG